MHISRPNKTKLYAIMHITFGKSPGKDSPLEGKFRLLYGLAWGAVSSQERRDL